MIETKLFEVRDSMTFMPVVAVLMAPYGSGGFATAPAETYLLRRSGFGDPLVWLSPIASHPEQATYSPYDWTRSRTLQVAHDFIQANWDALPTGAVVDVEFILGITPRPKQSEREEGIEALMRASIDGGGL